MRVDPPTEDLLRRCAPQVLAALTRRYGDFAACEDAVQEALLAAAVQWPTAGIPDNPRGWLVAVAGRRLTDEVRSETARRRREEAAERPAAAPPADDERLGDRDDSLALVFLCCHPVLSEPQQVALTLRSVGGLTTAQIAAAFLVPEATMTRRITRAKQRLKDVGARFTLPAPAELAARTGAVLRVLYLIFTEGHTASSGPDLIAPQLTAEAIRLTRELRRLLPDDPEVTGLLALLLLTEARHAARVAADGSLIPLDRQDRGRWDRGRIDEGIALLTGVLPTGRVGPYQLQAAIAAVHSEADSTESTDWPQILGLYGLLERLAPNPMVTLNRAIALAHVRGPDAALRLLDVLTGDRRIAGHHRLPAVRAHLLEMTEDVDAARTGYLAAARRTTSSPEKRYLEARAARLREG